MWVLFAFASAFFAGVTSILAKIGVKDNCVYNWFTKYNSKY